MGILFCWSQQASGRSPAEIVCPFIRNHLLLRTHVQLLLRTFGTECLLSSFASLIVGEFHEVSEA